MIKGWTQIFALKFQLFVALVLFSTLLLSLATVGDASTNPVFGSSRQLVLPTGAPSNSFGRLDSISCTASSDCTAVGWYRNSSDSTSAMVAVERLGKLSRAVGVTLPQDAHTSNSQLTAVSCTIAFSCTAVGSYSGLAFGVTESDGRVTPRFDIPPPANVSPSGRVNLTSISCTSVGNCLAAGNYVDRAGATEALVALESNGKFSDATELLSPSNAGKNPYSWVSGLSCQRVGYCTIVGSYVDESVTVTPQTKRPVSSQATVAVESNGRFSRSLEIASPVGAPLEPYAWLHSVRCTSIGNCVAVGIYDDTSTNESVGKPMVAYERGGKFSQAVTFTPPSLRGVAASYTNLISISCMTADICAFVGVELNNSLGSNALVQSMLGVESGTKLIQLSIYPSSTTTGGLAEGFLSSISCAGKAICETTAFNVNTLVQTAETVIGRA